MTHQIADPSPGIKARIAGGLWLLVIAAAGFAFAVTSGTTVRDDAAGTANSILANESLVRLAFVADLVAGLCYVGVTFLVYELLKPVSRSLSLLAAFFGLGGVAIGGPAFLSRLAPLLLLRGDDYLSVFSTSQMQAMALLLLKLHGVGLNISMVLFGVQCSLAGYLVFRSTFLPRFLGVLLGIAGSSYVINSFTTFLSPSSGATLSPFVAPVALLGEGSVSLWLLIIGMNVPRWRVLAGR